MPLAFEVDSTDTLDDAVKPLYAKDEKSGKFRLSIDGLPQPEDTTGLKKKNDELLAELKQGRDAKKAAEDAARAAAEETARKKGDIAALEKSWGDKFSAREIELTTETTRLNASLNKVLVDSVATNIAAELAIQGSANVLLPHIRNRLTVDWVDGQPVTKVLGLDGKPSALTPDELKAEFAANKAFAPLIAATKASGGGASGAGGGGAADKTMTRAQWDSKSPVERMEFAKKGGKVVD